MNLKQLLAKINLDLSNVTVEDEAGTDLNYDFDIVPEVFLSYAQADFAKCSKHGYVNSLANTKRAIDCQTDQILGCFGISFKKKRFPEKQETLHAMGIIAPGILRKVVNKRHKLEHRYECPSKEDAEDAIDVASLFIDASNKSLAPFWGDFSLYDRRGDRWFSFSYKEEEHLFGITGWMLPKAIGTVKIGPKHKAYLSLIKLAIAIRKDENVRECIKNFFDLAQ